MIWPPVMAAMGVNDYVLAKVNGKAQLGKMFRHNSLRSAKCPRCSGICGEPTAPTTIAKSGSIQAQERSGAAATEEGFEPLPEEPEGEPEGAVKGDVHAEELDNVYCVSLALHGALVHETGGQCDDDRDGHEVVEDIPDGKLSLCRRE